MTDSIDTTIPTPTTTENPTPTTGLAAAAVHPLRKRRPWWVALTKQRLALTGIILIGIFIIIALVLPVFAPYGPTEQIPTARLAAPSWDHPFGGDMFGRDVMTRLIYGARVSFQVGIIAVGISAIIGTLLGMAAGYHGGLVDSLITLLGDVMYSFPAILLAIAMMTALGKSLTNVMLAIGIVNAPSFMRIVRGAVLAVRHTTYVESAHAIGADDWRIIRQHIFPNITAPLIVHASLNFATAVLSEASLSYLGLGNPPPNPSWGGMVSESYGQLQIAPWAAVFPGIAIGLTVLGFNLVGDGLRDALDPRLRNLD